MKLPMPKDKYMSAVQVDGQGRIAIPEEVREMFGIQPGEKLLFLADKRQGMALQRGAL